MHDAAKLTNPWLKHTHGHRDTFVIIISSATAELNKNIITLLNKVTYLSDSRHVKRRYVNKAIKLLEVKEKPVPPIHSSTEPLANSSISLG